MRRKKDMPFRYRNFRGAKIEDLYFYLQRIVEEDKENSEYVEEIQRFIKYTFNYDPLEETEKKEIKKKKKSSK